MSQLESLAPWALVLLGIWLVMWAVDKVFQPKHPVWTGVMAVVAFIAGLLLILTH